MRPCRAPPGPPRESFLLRQRCVCGRPRGHPRRCRKSCCRARVLALRLEDAAVDAAGGTGLDKTVVHFRHVLDFPAEDFLVEGRDLCWILRHQYPVNRGSTHDEFLSYSFGKFGSPLLRGSVLCDARCLQFKLQFFESCAGSLSLICLL